MGNLGGSNKMLSADQVGDLLGVSARTVREYWKPWGLQAYRIGKHLRWRERDVVSYVESHRA